MSLINQMLKDLEARRRHADPGTGAVVPPQAGNRPWLRISGAVVLLLGCGAVCGWVLAQRYMEVSTPCAPAPMRYAVTSPAPASGSTLSGAPSATPTNLDPAPQAAAGADDATMDDSTRNEGNAALQAPTSPMKTQAVHTSAPSSMQPAQQAGTHPPNLQQRAAGAAPPAPSGTVAPANASAPSISKPDLLLRQRQLLDQGRELYQNADYPGTVRILNKGIACASVSALDAGDNPGATELAAALHQQLTLAQLRLQRPEAAMATLENGHRLAPEHIGLHLLYARVLLDQGKAGQAATMLEQLPQPEMLAQPDFYALRAALARKTGALQEAVQLYAGLCRLDPERGDWRLGLAISQHQSGAMAQARANYQRVAANRDLNPQLRSFASSQIKLLMQP